MVATDEDALICDLAETYQIYDYIKNGGRFFFWFKRRLKNQNEDE